MPRNSSGTMSGTNGPYTAGTTISSAAINARFADDEAETTDSLSRSGKGGMLAVLRGVDGTVAAPAYSFTSEPGTGAYRAAASDYRIALGGVDALQVTASGITVSRGNVTLTVLNSGMVQTAAGSPAYVVGNAVAANAAGVDVILSSTATRTAGYLANIQNSNDATKALRVDYQGLVTLGGQAAAIQPASIWTAITLNAGWTGTVSYFKDATGRVQVKGFASFATGGAAAAFNLPTGFRADKYMPIVDYSSLTTVPASVSSTNGAVSVAPSGGPVNLHLYYFDAISFIAEA